METEKFVLRIKKSAGFFGGCFGYGEYIFKDNKLYFKILIPSPNGGYTHIEIPTDQAEHVGIAKIGDDI